MNNQINPSGCGFEPLDWHFLKEDLSPFVGLPACYAESSESLECMMPVIEGLNRGVVALCAFTVGDALWSNLILLEIPEEYRSPKYLTSFLNILSPPIILVSKASESDSDFECFIRESFRFVVIDSILCMEPERRKNLCADINAQIWKTKYIQTPQPEGLNIGCGPRPIKNWINIDLHPNFPQVDYTDASKILPFPDNSFPYVFSEHMLEHLNFRCGIHFLREAYRILMPDGFLILSIPTLDFLMKLYQSPDEEINRKYIDWSAEQFDPNLKRFFGDDKIPAMFIVNNFMRFWGHQLIYDNATIVRLLKHIGFRKADIYLPGEYKLNGRPVEQHGTVIPSWANALEAQTFVAKKQ